MYQIELTHEAVNDLRSLPKRAAQIVLDGVEEQLLHEPGRETRNRKRLRPNQLAEWEIRAGDYRVFYDVDEAARCVKVVAIGRKEGNRLIIRNEEFQL